MEFDKLEDDLYELSVELTALKLITDGLDKKWNPQIYKLQQTVERLAGDNDEMQAQLNTLRRSYASNNHNGRVELDEILIKELNVKVTESLEAVQALKEPAFQTFLLQIAREKLKRYLHYDLIMITSKFSNQIGFGGFSKVYLGRLSDGVQVAVKVLKQNRDIPKNVLQDIFVIEVSTMIKASHPNLIKLYGFCFDDNMKALIYEYMENGSLDKVLFKKHIVVEWRRLYEIAIDTAKVLAYLHHGCVDRIIHHDIKPANILLDSNLIPKVTDFGVAKIMNRDLTHFTMTRTRGTSCYIAPEMTMQASRITCTCDVYSFGMTLFDILGMRINSRAQPTFRNEVWRKFDKGKLDEIIKECDIREEDAKIARVLSMIALWCIQFTPEIRPSMKDVVNVLENKLQVAAPPNPSFASNELFSIIQSQDTTYSTVSTFTHQSLPEKNWQLAAPPNPLLVPQEDKLSPEYEDELWSECEDQLSPTKQSKETTYSTNFPSTGQRCALNTPKATVEQFSKATPKQFSKEELKSFTSNFSNKVNSDEFSDVYKGEFTNGMPILVKVLSESYDDYSYQRFEAEMEVLSITSHQNIIKLYGFCFTENMKALVFEYMANGSLADFLFEPHSRSIEWEELYRIATETAKAISYLHDGCAELIIHLDIKPKNILLNSSFSPKVANFHYLHDGADRDLSHQELTKAKGTLFYTAPEIFYTSRITDKCDVYSFGIMLFEIFGRQRIMRENVYFKRVCWENFENGQLEEFLTKNGFTEKNREKATILLMVAFWCVQFTPAARPPMKTVVMMLEEEREVVAPPNPFIPTTFD